MATHASYFNKLALVPCPTRLSFRHLLLTFSTFPLLFLFAFWIQLSSSLSVPFLIIEIAQLRPSHFLFIVSFLEPQMPTVREPIVISLSRSFQPDPTQGRRKGRGRGRETAVCRWKWHLQLPCFTRRLASVELDRSMLGIADVLINEDAFVWDNNMLISSFGRLVPSVKARLAITNETYTMGRLETVGRSAVGPFEGAMRKDIKFRQDIFMSF